MKRKLLWCVGLAVVGSLLGGGMAVASSRSHQDYPPRPGSTPIICICIPTTGTGSSSPPRSATPAPRATARTQPSAAQVRQALVRTALTDRYVKGLLGGRRYATTAVSTWKGARGRALGSAVALRFTVSQTVAGWWLRLWRVPYKAAYQGVHGLVVDVSSGTKRVEAITAIMR